MKKGKKIFLIILTIIFIIMFLIGVMVVKDLKEEDKLRDDISEDEAVINADTANVSEYTEAETDSDTDISDEE